MCAPGTCSEDQASLKLTEILRLLPLSTRIKDMHHHTQIFYVLMLCLTAQATFLREPHIISVNHHA